ncbi:MAG TPA: hypothetical protein VK899_10300, partial [Gemmatimonadales bacterium]|nr:hypothetical protein [Gemmatimonadales bacterium]
MTSHDQLSKSLIKLFFTDFLHLIDPESASLLRAGEAIFLDKEDFTDWPAGDRREMDLVAKVPMEGKDAPLLVHVEIETDFHSGMDHRLWQYYMMLHLRHTLPVLPILVNLRGGRAGVHREALREVFGGKVISVFHYQVLGISACRAEEWLAKPEPIAWAFAALMRPGSWSRAELKLECLRRIAASDVVGLRKLVLVDWVETYVQLTEQDALELRRLLDLEGNEEIKTMELTWLGQAEARGIEQGVTLGAETATRKAVERMRRVVFRLMAQRFGAVPAKTRRKIEAIDSLEPLADLAE